MIQLDRWERIGRWFMTAWVLFLVPALASILSSGLNPPALAVTSGLLVWAIAWTWLWLRALGRNHAGEVTALIAITAISAVFTLIEPSPQATILVFAFIIAGCIFPFRQALVALLVLSVIQVGALVVRQTEPLIDLNILINDVLVGLVGVGARIFWRAYGERVAPREQLAQLAVAAERLRFARDPHGLLGQSVSVPVLK